MSCLESRYNYISLEYLWFYTQFFKGEMSHAIKILFFIPCKSLRAKRQSRLANRGERSERTPHLREKNRRKNSDKLSTYAGNNARGSSSPKIEKYQPNHCFFGAGVMNYVGREGKRPKTAPTEECDGSAVRGRGGRKCRNTGLTLMLPLFWPITESGPPPSFPLYSSRQRENSCF